MIVVCGEALIDKVDNGDGTERAAPGGGPFNTARALARLGVPTAYLGHLSEDAHGRELAGLLTADGASLALATSGPEPTTVAVAEVDDAGVADYRFFIHGMAAPNLTLDMVPAEFGPDVRALHVGTLGLVLESMASTLAQLVRREFGHRLVMVDPNNPAGTCIRPPLPRSPTPSGPASSPGCIIAMRCDQIFASMRSSLNRCLPSLARSHPSPARVPALSHPGGPSLIKPPDSIRTAAKLPRRPVDSRLPGREA